MTSAARTALRPVGTNEHGRKWKVYRVRPCFGNGDRLIASQMFVIVTPGVPTRDQMRRVTGVADALRGALSDASGL